MAQTITFKYGKTLPTIAVYSQKELIQGAYRECFEIRFPIEATAYDELSALATPENLSELILMEMDSETDKIITQFTHSNFAIVTGLGLKTAPEDGSQYYFLSVAQKSDAELALEKLEQDNEDIQAAMMELAEIIVGETEE